MTGKKFDDNKPRMDLVPNLAIVEVGKVMTFGAKKYGDYNWLGGMKLTRLAAAGLRHWFAWLQGEDLDSESGLSHLAHAASCALMTLELLIRQSTLDDRYRAGTSEVSGACNCGCDCAQCAIDKSDQEAAPPQSKLNSINISCYKVGSEWLKATCCQCGIHFTAVSPILHCKNASRPYTTALCYGCAK